MALALAAPGRGAPEPASGLFASHETLRLELVAPLRQIARHGGAGRGELVLATGGRIGVGVELFGKSRRELCRVPPLALRPDPAAAAGSPFAGLPIVRLIPDCETGAGASRYVLLEYLLYRLWGLAAEPALAVRLAEIDYVETEGGKGRRALAFFVEEIASAAARHGLVWLDVERQSLADLDPRQVALFTLFQYMVGNTDWSVLRGAEGERCCHNVAVLGDAAGGSRRLLPYDFDQAGLVDAPYATPSSLLDIPDVTRRAYRGFCSTDDELSAAVARLGELEGAFAALLLDEALPQPRVRQRAHRYLKQFYATLEDPAKFDRLVRGRCRGAGRE